MKALSLWQPWAAMIAVGEKRIETRGWTVQYRGWLAIHAGKTTKGLDDCGIVADDGSDEAIMFEPWLSIWKRQGWSTVGEGLAFGAFVAVARLEGCYDADTMLANHGGPDRPFERQLGGYGPERYGWLLSDVVALPEPVPARGKQGIWTPPPSEIEQLREQYRAATQAAPA